MRFHSLISLLATASLLSACSLFHPAHPVEGPATGPGPSTGPSAGQPGTAQPEPGTPTPAVPEPPRPPPKQFKLGPATASLVAQAHKQASTGNYEPAAATIERALRIEPENPLLWIELGQVRLSEGNAAQADGMGHKALALATGDVTAQSSAWRLIADSLRARQRNQEAADAEKKAATLSTR
jgi:cytochrome c-type biogenesis protein CcmH/NrfG